RLRPFANDDFFVIRKRSSVQCSNSTSSAKFARSITACTRVTLRNRTGSGKSPLRFSLTTRAFWIGSPRRNRYSTSAGSREEAWETNVPLAAASATSSASDIASIGDSRSSIERETFGPYEIAHEGFASGPVFLPAVGGISATVFGKMA